MYCHCHAWMEMATNCKWARNGSKSKQVSKVTIWKYFSRQIKFFFLKHRYCYVSEEFLRKNLNSIIKSQVSNSKILLIFMFSLLDFQPNFICSISIPSLLGWIGSKNDDLEPRHLTFSLSCALWPKSHSPFLLSDINNWLLLCCLTVVMNECWMLDISHFLMVGVPSIG